uniref:hypothetical protein n=1 Tax=Escherichia coli TaxID=562 RepID=UPI00296223B7|nr:hypothetical protein [Escherichia coli]
MIWQPEFTDKTLSRKPGAVQAAGSQQLQLIPKIRETCCGKYICNNVCFGMATFKPNEFEFDS